MRRRLPPAEEFRRKAHARLADVAARFAHARVHAQFAWLCDREAAALAGACTAPRGEEELHLLALADRASERSAEVAPEQSGSFYEFAFSSEVRDDDRC